jgi:hypothetical protein
LPAKADLSITFAQRRQAWEYCEVLTLPRHAVADCNARGREGWILAAALPGGEAVRLIFRRPKASRKK